MTLTTILGIIGGIVLILGAAREEKKAPRNPRKSIKDRLFAIGGVIMLVYATLWYQAGWSIFYVLLEIFVCLASILMMLNTNDTFDTRFLGIGGAILIAISFYLSQSTDTLRFILGLIGIALGYTFKPCTMRRDAALTIGSLLIVVFSFLQSNWIFFGLNIFFAFFSAYYWMKDCIEKKK